MSTRIIAVFLLFFSGVLWADWLKQDVQPEVASRDAWNSCLFDGPVYLKIKAEAGQAVRVHFTDPSSGITHPLSIEYGFSEPFKGLVPAALPAGYELVANGRYWWIDVALWDASGTYITDERIISFVCPSL